MLGRSSEFHNFYQGRKVAVSVLGAMCIQRLSVDLSREIFLDLSVVHPVKFSLPFRSFVVTAFP